MKGYIQPHGGYAPSMETNSSIVDSHYRLTQTQTPRPEGFSRRSSDNSVRSPTALAPINSLLASSAGQDRRAGPNPSSPYSSGAYPTSPVSYSGTERSRSPTFPPNADFLKASRPDNYATEQYRQAPYRPAQAYPSSDRASAPGYSSGSAPPPPEMGYREGYSPMSQTYVGVGQYPPQDPAYASYNGSSMYGSYVGDPSNSNFSNPAEFVESRGKRRRGNLPKTCTDYLRTWFHQHLDHPYPSEEEKQEMILRTGLSIAQVMQQPPFSHKFETSPSQNTLN